jgi:hypothetical protein
MCQGGIKQTATGVLPLPIFFVMGTQLLQIEKIYKNACICEIFYYNVIKSPWGLVFDNLIDPVKCLKMQFRVYFFLAQKGEYERERG